MRYFERTATESELPMDNATEPSACLAAGQDVPSQTAGGTAARIIPDSKWVRHRLANLWPGGALTLVKRMPAPNPADEPTSVFRISKGDDAVLIFIESSSNERVSTLRTAPDREYDW